MFEAVRDRTLKSSPDNYDLQKALLSALLNGIVATTDSYLKANKTLPPSDKKKIEQWRKERIADIKLKIRNVETLQSPGVSEESWSKLLSADEQELKGLSQKQRSQELRQLKTELESELQLNKLPDDFRQHFEQEWLPLVCLYLAEEIKKPDSRVGAILQVELLLDVQTGVQRLIDLFGNPQHFLGAVQVIDFDVEVMRQEMRDLAVQIQARLDEVGEKIIERLDSGFEGMDKRFDEVVELLKDKQNQNKTLEIDGKITIFGPRPSGKITFLTTLAYFFSTAESSRLIDYARDILQQGFTLPAPHRIEEYYFSIVLQPQFSAVNVELNCEYCLVPGEFFQHFYKFKNDHPGAWGSFINEFTSQRLALIIDANSQRDSDYAKVIASLQQELNAKTTSSERIKYRIAIIFSCFDQPEVWPYRKDLENFTAFKFSKTRDAIEKWIVNWGCSSAYFACSAFGMIGNTSTPNCHGEYGGIAQPEAWKPFGLVAPIYWLLTGKYEEKFLIYKELSE
ncbi:hypothetical protein ACE1CD_12900 [Aerosakkonema sp. BLCC-F183]|uniref:hypothetical protein n=1 Tax=Aerosakkonema sp. BLCC-F183 TaxID=3342834 RepID=UPI0035B6B7FB